MELIILWNRYITTFTYTTIGILIIIFGADGRTCAEYDGWHCVEYDYDEDFDYNYPNDIPTLVDRIVSNIFFLYCYFMAFAYTFLSHLRIHYHENSSD